MVSHRCQSKNKKQKKNIEITKIKKIKIKKLKKKKKKLFRKKPHKITWTMSPEFDKNVFYSKRKKKQNYHGL